MKEFEELVKKAEMDLEKDFTKAADVYCLRGIGYAILALAAAVKEKKGLEGYN